MLPLFLFSLFIVVTIVATRRQSEGRQDKNAGQKQSDAFHMVNSAFIINNQRAEVLLPPTAHELYSILNAGSSLKVEKPAFFFIFSHFYPLSSPAVFTPS